MIYLKADIRKNSCLSTFVLTSLYNTPRQDLDGDRRKIYRVRMNRINAVLKRNKRVRGQRVSEWQRWALWLVIL